MTDNIGYVVFDVETGGLNYKKNPVLEIAMIAVFRKNGKLTETKYCVSEYIKQPYFSGSRIEKQALAINKIDLNYIKVNGKNLKTVVAKIIHLAHIVENHTKNKMYRDNKPILVGFNIDNFDMNFLKKMFVTCGYRLDDYFNKATIDLYQESKLLLGSRKLPNLKLATILKYYKINKSQSHGALDDTRDTVKLFLKYYNNLKAPKGTI